MATSSQVETLPSYDDSKSAHAQPSSWVLSRFLYKKPCKAPRDPKQGLTWPTTDTTIRWLDDFLPVPAAAAAASSPPDESSSSLESLFELARERIRQRFALDCDPDEMHMYMRIKLGEDRFGHTAPRVLVHDGNKGALREMLARPDAHLQVFFGEIVPEKNSEGAPEKGSKGLRKWL